MTISRLHGLDLLRASMMWLGVVLHGAQMYLSTDLAVDYYWDPARSPSMDVTLIVINTFRMPVFFALSGFFVAMLLERRGMVGMLRNRGARIVVPFLLFLPLLAALMTALQVVGANILATGLPSFDLSAIDDASHLLDKTHNLWFLYYLAMLIACSAGIVYLWIALKRPAKAWIVKLDPSSPLVLLCFIVLMSAIGSTSESGRISANLSFLPSLMVLLWFGTSYAFGWFIYHRLLVVDTYRDLAWRFIVAAGAFLLIGGAAFAFKGSVEPAKQQWLHALLSISTGASTVFFICGFIGLFQRYFNHYSAIGRYFSDSAYWIFIIHSVFLVALALPMAHLDWPAEIKFLLVCSGTLVLSVISYDTLVRNTVIGEILNGRRYSRGLPAST